MIKDSAVMKEAMLYEKLGGGNTICGLCGHRCKLPPGAFGICGVRQNIEGQLFTYAYGCVIASNVDPIEKKPLYHFLPGSSSFSIATAGCNFKCSFCQNWQISQLSKNEKGVFCGSRMSPEEVVKKAKKEGSKSISYTYSEPTVFFEYAYDTSKVARKNGLYNIFVTNGYMAKEALEAIRPYLDACNVDLKSFREDFYRDICGGHLQNVTDSIKLMKDMGIWIEITTLIIPSKNDSYGELKEIAEFIAGVGKEIPWHVSRFHPDYKYINSGPTPVETLKLAGAVGKKAGLKYVYFGNASEGNDTYCYNCNHALIQRAGFDIVSFNIKDAACEKCGARLEGKFQEAD